LPPSERRRLLQSILPVGSPVIAEAVSVEGRGCELFALVRANDLEGIVAKRLAHPYGPRTRWLKIRNQDYSQQEGRGGATCSTARGVTLRGWLKLTLPEIALRGL
jgi:ATP-dependent DNA ligase